MTNNDADPNPYKNGKDPTKSWEDFLNFPLWNDPDKKRPQPRSENDKDISVGDIVDDICESIQSRNTEGVKKLFNKILWATEYSRLKEGSNTICNPIVGSLHYGCGLLGAWFPLEFRPHEAYFTYYTQNTPKGKKGWSVLTRSGRTSFEGFYRKELPLRAHLASNPFLKEGLTFFLSVNDEECKQEKENESILFFCDTICQELHNWLIKHKDVASFLDGDAADSLQMSKDLEKFIKNDLVKYLKNRTNHLLPNTNAEQKLDEKTAEKLDKKTAEIAFRSVLTAVYSALHLKVFEDPNFKFDKFDVTGIMVRIDPLYPRPFASTPKPNSKRPGYEYCDFANFISGYLIAKAKDNNRDANAAQPIQFTSTWAMQEADKVKTNLERIVGYLSKIEQLSLSAFSGMSDLTSENIIRECTVVDEEVLYHMNRWRAILLQNIEGNGKDTNLTASIKENQGMVGASQTMIDLFCRLKARMKDCKNKFLQIFFYSEPGCGKEDLALLCHLMSPKIELGNREYKNDELKSLKKTFFYGVEFDDVQNILNNDAPLLDMCVEGKEQQRLWKFNPDQIIHSGGHYFPVNCGISHDEEMFDRYVFGRVGGGLGGENETRVGAVLAAYLTDGTVFFDEFNTIEPEFASKFLRFTEKPYKFSVRGVAQEFEAKILAIFASNKSKDELIGDNNIKINRAVVYRISKNYYRIPPLRERKEDIAVFVLHRLLKKKEDEPEFNELNCVRRISTDAMRLICELDWRENYRGIDGFLNILMDERRWRNIEVEEISFSEVLYALKKMDALKAGVQLNKS